MPEIFVASSDQGRPYAEMAAAALHKQGATAITWWSQQAFPLGVTLIESLDRLASRVDGALIVMTPDDETTHRGARVYIARPNVLLEYGLFSGRLGRSCVAVMRVGPVTLPSDLDGVAAVQARAIEAGEDPATYQATELEPSFTAWLHDLELGSSDGARLSAWMARLMPNTRPDERQRAKARMLRQQINPRALPHLPNDTLEHLLLKHTFDNDPRIGVGYAVTTAVTAYLALGNLAAGSDDERALAGHFAHFIANLITERRVAPGVIAISKRGAVGLLQATARQLRIPTILVDPTGPNRANPIEGYFEPGDRALFLHHVALSGNHLLDCIGALRACGLRADHIATLALHQGGGREFKSLMDTNKIHVHANSLLLEDKRRVACGNPSIDISTVAVLDCVLCDVVGNSENAPIRTFFTPAELPSEVLMESDSFVVIADVAPVAPGHVLVVTKDHRISLSKCSDTALEELDALRKRAADVLTKACGRPVVMFEHGLCNRARASGCGIDHAHLHLVPTDVSLAQQFEHDFTVVDLPSLSALADYADHAEEYLLLTDQAGQDRLALLSDETTRQYFRRLLSARLRRELWNWHDEFILGRKDDVRALIQQVHTAFAG